MPELWLHEVGNALTRPPNHSGWDAGDPPRFNLSNAFPSRGWLVLDLARRSGAPLYEDAYDARGSKSANGAGLHWACVSANKLG